MKDDCTCPIAEVDLREGGSYRLGMKMPDKDEPYVCFGTFVRIDAPRKLVYTCSWEHSDTGAENSQVTVEFLDRSGSTEIMLTHERFATEGARDEHNKGWTGVSERLAGLAHQLSE